MMRIGFIGLGHMGAPMARNLFAAGFPVTVYDLDPAAVAELESHGAASASDVAACCADADVLITMLPGPAQVRDVLGGALGALRAGAVAIDMSTSSAAVGRELLEAARRHDVAMLDAPVAGMAAGARAGTLSIFVGGDADVLADVRPVLEAIGDPERIFHVGGHGAGYGVKLLLNLLWFMHAVAAAEVLTVGARAGIDLGVLRTALVNSPANSNFIERDVLSVLDDGDYDDAFALRLVTKDLGLAVDMARDVGVPVELAALVEQIHRRARAQYGDTAGEMSAVRLYEDLAGLQLRLQEVAHVG
jgi:3-hydroxyisobutyrate dehydrogenase